MDSCNGDTGLPCRVSPFRHPRIKVYMPLPAAFRSLSRLSSALSAKASALRPLCLIISRDFFLCKKNSLCLYSVLFRYLLIFCIEFSRCILSVLQPIKVRQPPGLPRRLQRSTFGRLRLNRRVRDGNGCDPQTHRHRKVREVNDKCDSAKRFSRCTYRP